MKIIGAFYNSLDVTEKVKKLTETSNTFKVCNEVFGDPEYGKVKEFYCRFINESGTEIVITARENEYVSLQGIVRSDRLAIYYTDNSKPKIIRKTLGKIVAATHTSNTQLVVSSFQQPEFDTQWIKSLWSESGFPTLNSQLVQAMHHANKIGKYKYISFLEHDVLYPPSYFNYPDFSNHNVLFNKNYIGVCESGYQKYSGHFNALSQLTMRFDFAIDFFTNQLIERVSGKFPIWIEPIEESMQEYNCPEPSIHINKESLTNHKQFFEKIPYSQNDKFWGHYRNCWVD